MHACQASKISGTYVQFLVDKDLDPLSCLVNLRELSLSGAISISGTGLACLQGLSRLQVSLSSPAIMSLAQKPCIYGSAVLRSAHQPFSVCFAHIGLSPGPMA